MENKLMAKLLPSIIKARGEAEISVTGVSMDPTLKEGDIVTVKRSESYAPGDILVYAYKNEGLLIHRLLKADGRYFCKGDNALRLEDIDFDEIIGKVILVNGEAVHDFEQWKIKLSYAVNREFFRCRYDRTKVKESNIYKIYSEIILKKEVTKMNYIKTEKMDFILSDETSLAVFDPESGNTYFFDETGIDILNCLEEASGIDELIEKLCEIYEAEPEDIRSDVEEFLADTVTKGIVEVI